MVERAIPPPRSQIEMKRISQLLLSEGVLTGLGAALLLLVGLSIMLGSAAFLPLVWMRWVGALVGLGCVAVAGLSGRAKALGLPPPFTNDPLGWRKAKTTYKQQVVPKADLRGNSASEQSESEK
jgi:hypothetical protein